MIRNNLVLQLWLIIFIEDNFNQSALHLLWQFYMCSPEWCTSDQYVGFLSLIQRKKQKS